MLPNKKVLLVNFEKISSDKLAFQITENHRPSNRNMIYANCRSYSAPLELSLSVSARYFVVVLKISSAFLHASANIE